MCIRTDVDSPKIRAEETDSANIESVVLYPEFSSNFRYYFGFYIRRYIKINGRQCDKKDQDNKEKKKPKTVNFCFRDMLTFKQITH